MTKVIITGWHRNFLAISFVKLVRKATGEGLASAKNKLDRILEGQAIENRTCGRLSRELPH
jgi:hypothetical protein